MSTSSPKIQLFDVVAKDTGGEWVVMRSGLSPREARTRMVAEAGVMANGGWTAVGVDRQGIVMAHPDDDARRTNIRICKTSPKD